MNKHQKGNRNELLVRKDFEAMGYECFKPVWNRFARKDIFGADFVGFNLKTRDLVFVQVKSNTGDVYRAVKEFKSLMPRVKEVHQLIFVKRNCVSDKKIS